MPSNSRAENQYYGKYRECCVVAHLNRADVEYHENYVFTTEEQNILSNEAKLIADFIGNHTATYLGNHTANESGDILLDNGETVEIKTVSAGSGTYFNTSIYYFKILSLTISLNAKGLSITCLEYWNCFKKSSTHLASLCVNGINFTYSGLPAIHITAQL